jgi:hypothetical protein
MENRLQVMLAAVQTVRPALDHLYRSLSDEQNARFNAVAPTSDAVAGQDQRNLTTLCDQRTPGMTDLPIDRIAPGSAADVGAAGGAKPSDMPIEQSPRFYMVVNLKTAALLGVSLSDVCIARANEVREYAASSSRSSAARLPRGRLRQACSSRQTTVRRIGFLLPGGARTTGSAGSARRKEDALPGIAAELARLRLLLSKRSNSARTSSTSIRATITLPCGTSRSLRRLCVAGYPRSRNCRSLQLS